MPTARSARSRAISTGCRSSCRCPSIRLLDGSSGGGSVAAMVPKQAGAARASARKARAPSRPAGRGWRAAAARSCPATSAAPMYAEQLATVPVVNMLLGSVVGIGAAKAVLGHFSVMVRDIAQLFVAGPPVVSHAMGYDITKEDLGGWHIHCRNGSVDNLAETEEEAMAMTRRFLSYLPSSVYEAPPVAPTTDPADRREEELFTLVPRKRTTTFDMRRAIRLMADKDSLLRDRAAVGHRPDRRLRALRRPSDGRHRLGQPARQRRRADRRRLRQAAPPPRPLRPLPPADPQPGRQSGLRRRPRARDRRHDPQGRRMDDRLRPGRGADLHGDDAPQLRRRRQQLRDAAVRRPRCAWPGRRPTSAASRRRAASRRPTSASSPRPPIPPALRAEINARIESVRGPIGPLNRFQIEEMIDPRDTRRLVCEWIADAYRIVTQPLAAGAARAAVQALDRLSS